MLRDLIDFADMSKSEWDAMFSLALEIERNPAEYAEIAKGKILASMFYEPSTRTKFSFQSAMLRLGGNIIGFDGTSATSVSKGESVKDTARIVSSYADIIVVRSPVKGTAEEIANQSDVPVINAGDGTHLHPTQTMVDLFTIGYLTHSHEITGKKIGICGDLLYGRTVHSLLSALAWYGNNEYYFISSPSLEVPQEYADKLVPRNKINITRSLDCIDELDILYMTRIQKERFPSEADYLREKGAYVLNRETLSRAKDDLIILHPLPRNDELAEDIDDDPRAKYFLQAKLGVPLRMALIATLLGKI
ncbi:aspartate carbamoyltransferase [Clostridia bacterium]|nr:aspartate carbamoyltransferase [Clostridia bacterium]